MSKALCSLLAPWAMSLAMTMQISYAGDLTVVTEEWKPYNYSENNEIKGLSTEIVKKVLERAAIHHTISVYPWSRAYAMAQSTPDVMIFTIIRIAPREHLFKWVRPLGKGGVSSLYRLKSKPQVNPASVEEAKNYSIVANQDSMDHLWLQSSGFTKVSTPPKVENAVRMFFGGRVDMIAFDDAVIQQEFTKFGFDPADAVRVMPLFTTPPYMALSLATPDEVLHKLQKAYDELMREGKIKLVN